MDHQVNLVPMVKTVPQGKLGRKADQASPHHGNLFEILAGAASAHQAHRDHEEQLVPRERPAARAPRETVDAMVTQGAKDHRDHSAALAKTVHLDRLAIPAEPVNLVTVARRDLLGPRVQQEAEDPKDQQASQVAMATVEPTATRDGRDHKDPLDPKDKMLVLAPVEVADALAKMPSTAPALDVLKLTLEHGTMQYYYKFFQ